MLNNIKSKITNSKAKITNALKNKVNTMVLRAIVRATFESHPEIREIVKQEIDKLEQEEKEDRLVEGAIKCSLQV